MLLSSDKSYLVRQDISTSSIVSIAVITNVLLESNSHNMSFERNSLRFSRLIMRKWPEICWFKNPQCTHDQDGSNHDEAQTMASRSHHSDWYRPWRPILV